MKYSVRSIIVTLLMVGGVVILDTTFKFTIENVARQQARYNLEQVKGCTVDILRGIKSPSNSDIERALKVCAKDMKVTPTGDMFAYDLTSKELIFDPSLDCYTEGVRVMKADRQCLDHKDPIACAVALKAMNSGYNSDAYAKTSWRFNDSNEFLEWVVLPTETIGFDFVQRGGQVRPKQILLAQGVVENELMVQHRMFSVMLYLVTAIIMVVNLVLGLKIKDSNANSTK